ncbi:MAG: hypothetical protein WA947_08480 [Phormidesmis sp.]
MPTLKISELPDEVKEYFEFNEEHFELVRSELENPSPFEAQYTPSEIELLLDDVVCGVIDASNAEAGLRPVRTPLSEHPETIELKFDDQTALLVVRGHEVINRLANMREFDLRTNLSISAI